MAACSQRAGMRPSLPAPVWDDLKDNPSSKLEASVVITLVRLLSLPSPASFNSLQVFFQTALPSGRPANKRPNLFPGETNPRQRETHQITPHVYMFITAIQKLGNNQKVHQQENG